MRGESHGLRAGAGWSDLLGRAVGEIARRTNEDSSLLQDTVKVATSIRRGLPERQLVIADEVTDVLKSCPPHDLLHGKEPRAKILRVRDGIRTLSIRN